LSGEGGGGKSGTGSSNKGDGGDGGGVEWAWECGSRLGMWRTWPLDNAVRGTDDAPEGGDSKDAAEQPRGGTTRPPAHRIVHSPVMHGAMISVES
jgi:hypothetical protein